MVVSICQLHLYQEIYRSPRQLPFFGRCWSECDVTYGILAMAAIVVESRRQIARSQNRSRMCEIRLTKLSCAAQQVSIVHFYAVTEIKGLSCRLWWMREWRNLLTSTHVGYRSVIRAVASGASLKFGVQGASATNWFSQVNGARDNGIRLYMAEEPFVKLPSVECHWTLLIISQNWLITWANVDPDLCRHTASLVHSNVNSLMPVNQVIIGNGLSLVCHQAITKTNSDEEQKQQFSFKENHFKMLSIKWWPFCLDLNELNVK